MPQKLIYIRIEWDFKKKYMQSHIKNIHTMFAMLSLLIFWAIITCKLVAISYEIPI